MGDCDFVPMNRMDAENERRMSKVKRDIIVGYYQKVFRPGSLMVTSGRRGGGKTHSAISFAQMLVNGYYPELGKWRIATNVIFVRKHREKFVTDYPGGSITSYH